MASAHRNSRPHDNLLVGSHYISGFEQISHVSAAFSRDKPLDSFLSARNLHSLQLWISNGAEQILARRLRHRDCHRDSLDFPGGASPLIL
jgi:hypothetical protein